MIADVPNIGQFLCLKGGENEKLQYEFIPSPQMQVDCMIPKKQLPTEINLNDGFKRELTIGKIAEVCQLGFD